jgi:hypothetical protein
MPAPLTPVVVHLRDRADFPEYFTGKPELFTVAAVCDGCGKASAATRIRDAKDWAEVHSLYFCDSYKGLREFADHGILR